MPLAFVHISKMRNAGWLCASFVLAVATAPFACGSDDSAPATDGPDAATTSDVSNDTDAVIEASNGCAASQETTNDGGCFSVVSAGARKLAMEIDPPAALNYATEVDVARGIGVSVVPITLPWSTLEPGGPDAGTSDIDTSLFADLAAVYSTRPVALLISIPLVDTASILAPPDLAPQLASGALAFDDAAVITRYEKLLDALFVTLGSNVKVPYLLVANEENLYLAARPDAMWTALANFYASIKTYVATKQPSITVGMNLSFGGLLDSAQRAKLTTLFATSPDVFVSYYLGDNGFGSPSSTTVPADIDTMISFAGARPLILKEFGYATGTTDHDPAGQLAFITDLFQAWDGHAAQIPMATISRMFDGTPTDCAVEAQQYVDGGNAELAAFLCTLGVRTVDDTPKPAWARLVDAASRRGF
jgi:hypothetical protein